MAEELKCGICNKVFKSRSGLTGHQRMSICRSSAIELSTHSNIRELIESLGDAFDRLENKLGNFTSEVQALKGHMGVVEDRLGNFQASFDTLDNPMIENLKARIAELEVIRSRYDAQISSTEGLVELVETADGVHHFFKDELGTAAFIMFVGKLCIRLHKDLPIRTTPTANLKALSDAELNQFLDEAKAQLAELQTEKERLSEEVVARALNKKKPGEAEYKL